MRYSVRSGSKPLPAARARGAERPVQPPRAHRLRAREGRRAAARQHEGRARDVGEHGGTGEAGGERGAEEQPIAEQLPEPGDVVPQTPGTAALRWQRLGHAHQAPAAHLEQTELVRGTEAVLQRVDHAQRVVAIAVERDHGVVLAGEQLRDPGRLQDRRVAAPVGAGRRQPMAEGGEQLRLQRDADDPGGLDLPELRRRVDALHAVGRGCGRSCTWRRSTRGSTTR